MLEELIVLGAERAIRVGTAGGLEPGLVHGELIVADRAIGADGTSRALGAGELVAADQGLTDALRAYAPEGDAERS